MLLRAAPLTLARDHTTRWWAEVNVEARDALHNGDTRMALALLDHAALPVGDEYVEQQFLGGAAPSFADYLRHAVRNRWRCRPMRQWRHPPPHIRKDLT